MDAAREAYWRKKLRPIHLGAESVEAQLAVKLGGMVVISGLTVFVGLFILAIFASFGRADVGLRIFGVVVVPATVWFWLDYWTLRRRARAYLRERDGLG
jgi:uncharacterized BrkB/YihY/UPF0761 family membrane protein